MVEIDPHRAPDHQEDVREGGLREYERKAAARMAQGRDEVPCARAGSRLRSAISISLFGIHSTTDPLNIRKAAANGTPGSTRQSSQKNCIDLVQEKMANYAVRGETKEFAFTKLMTCGLCGSGITADEKFKKQQNGNVHRYVYYGCCQVPRQELQIRLYAGGGFD